MNDEQQRMARKLMFEGLDPRVQRGFNEALFHQYGLPKGQENARLIETFGLSYERASFFDTRNLEMMALLAEHIAAGRLVVTEQDDSRRVWVYRVYEEVSS